MKNYLAIGFALAMIAGCGNKDEPKTAAPAPLAARQDAQTGPATPPPAPANAVDDGVQRPTPGQANDHSSPAFKDGGKADPKK
jgi:hypothetical protein